MKSIFLNFTIECSHCRKPMPVNGVSETILCPSCLEETDTPLEFWQVIARSQLMQALSMEPETDTGAVGMHASVGSYSMTYGNRNPRCQKCNTSWRIDDLINIHEGGKTTFICTNCKTGWSIRKPPKWLSRVMLYASFLIGETSDDSAMVAGHEGSGISIFCYNCGGSLPLDGSSRTVKCRNCGTELLVPDDVWRRLHPVTVSYPWFILVDLNEGETILPYEISDFIDLAGMPDDTIVLLYQKGEDCCIGRADQTGKFRWLEKNFGCRSSARLYYAEKMNKLWVIDQDIESVHIFDAETGKRELTIENEDHDPDLISVINNFDNTAVCHDNTVLVYRMWMDEKPPKKSLWQKLRPESRGLTPEEIVKGIVGFAEIRRFNSQGHRIPLWPGFTDEELDHEIPEWDTLHDQPALPPHGAQMVAGPEGTLYMIEKDDVIIARFDSTGKFTGVIKPSQKAVSDIEDCDVSGDGSLFVLFNHRKKIGGEDWSHIGKMDPDGSFQVLAGPHAPKNNFSFGSTVKRISVTSHGTIHVCETDFNNLRILNPDGSLLWRSPGTILEEERIINELNEARKNIF